MQKDYSILLLEGTLLLMLVKEPWACRITLDSSVIHLGSPVLASCSSYCPEIGKGVVVWKLDNDLLPEAQYRNVQENTSSVYISSFNKTSGLLQCYVKNSEGLQLMDEIHIRAGYSPSPPTNLSCLMKPLDNIVTCTWLPGEDSLLTTNVTLSGSRSVEQCLIPSKSEFNCTPKVRQNFCNISRGNYHFSKRLAVWVTVKNELGSATSAPVCFIPREEVKLDPIAFTEIKATTGGCIKLQWTYGKAGFVKELKCQLRYRSEFQKEWAQTAVEFSDETSHCGLLSVTKYHFQIRCIRKSQTGQWSEWGPSSSQITSESVPTGTLETWWKILETTEDSAMKIQLFWKALKKEEANANHIWYILKESTELLQKETPLCNTMALNCTFFLPRGIKRAFIWAQNTAGASLLKEIIFFPKNGEPVSRMYVSPNNEYSLRVEWEAQVSATAYVLEWCKSAQPTSSEIHWKTEFKGSNTSILQDNIEPYQMYTVTLYPVYKDSIGTPIQTNVYTKEKAPAFSPELKLASANESQIEVQWEPIPLEKRNGFITSYTVFWKDAHGKEDFSTLNGSVTRFKMKNILSFTTYEVLLRSSTAGGSVDSNKLTVHTTHLDNTNNTLMLLVLSPLLLLVTILVFIICLLKHERMKNQLWPIVPDPAKSQMGKWTSFMEETPRIMANPTDVTQFLTSDIAIVEGWQAKKPLTESHAKETPVTNTDEINNWRSYVNTDVVQYAQVITGGYREQSPPTSVYVRSDSTQPLLCDVSPSPQNYENMWFHSHHQEDNVFLVEEKETDFPLLQALQILENEESFHLLN
ncbi:PREDICTED: granulocyte colony-stimulating factor receptor [Nanorana parkeri]|uniref:granulocyte colony-stimulating factor receptor n=1 Tax=Nanorana parkeri TaxID=125878 RepID=UPI000854BB0E|nr:PREDICTED: granulocyte colony-stimulating factor receptor [Nanorana parkeri]